MTLGDAVGGRYTHKPPAIEVNPSTVRHGVQAAVTPPPLTEDVPAVQFRQPKESKAALEFREYFPILQLPHKVPVVPWPVAGEKEPVPALQFRQPNPSFREYFPILQLPHKVPVVPWPVAGE